jgi:hypothetical protein
LQSISQKQEQRILEKQINQLFSELVSIWRDTDIKKIESVKRLAARMEELYIQNGIAINTISGEIRRRLELAGIKTAKHVNDYLDDKYKRDYEIQSTTAITDNGDISGNNLLAILHKVNANISELTKEEAQGFYDMAKKMESAGKTVEEYCEIKGWPLLKDDYLANKKYDKVTTELPDPSRGAAWNAWNMYVMPEIERFYNTHNEIHKALEKLPPSQDTDEDMALAFKQYGNGMIKVLNDFAAPFKDLKFATTIKKWWKTTIRYFDHGKHAAGVMDAINSHKYLEEKQIETNAINDPLHPNCSYFVTLPEETKSMQDYIQPQLELLLQHLTEKHGCYLVEPSEPLDQTLAKLAPLCTIVKQRVKVQVPKERDLTREQCGDQIKSLVELAINFVPAIRAFQVLCSWREHTADGRVATRRIDAHPKLSELA